MKVKEECAKGFVCALPESVSPVLCKFWQLYGGVSGDLLQEGLCYWGNNGNSDRLYFGGLQNHFR